MDAMTTMEPRQDTSKRKHEAEVALSISDIARNGLTIDAIAEPTDSARKRPRVADDVQLDLVPAKDPAMEDIRLAAQESGEQSSASISQPDSKVPNVLATDALQGSTLLVQPSLENGNALHATNPPSPFASSSKTDARLLPEPFRPDPQSSSQSSLPPHVGGWILPDEPEIWEERKLGIDPNGDDEVVTSQVQSMLNPPRTDAPASSHPSSEQANIGHTVSSQPGSSTPPRRRARRAVAGKIASQPLSTQETSSSSGKIDISEALEYLDEIIGAPLSAKGSELLLQLVRASPLVPAFLKPEIERHVDSIARTYERAGGSGSDSETQDDGFLRTKARWVFELCKIAGDGSSIGGEDLVADTSADMDSIVLIVDTRAPPGVTAKRVPRESVLAWRSDVRTNPWFDESGQPFAVTYRSPHLGSGSNSSYPSQSTQAGSQELQALRDELQRAEQARDELSEEIAVVIASKQTSEEQTDLIRRLYEESSTLASSAEREAAILREENERLRYQVVESVNSTQALANGHIASLEHSLRDVTIQRDLLLRQNELTDDEMRRKAAEWDVQEARRIQEQQRRERAEAARLESNLALQATLLGNEFSRRPQDYMLAVDLAAQRRDVEATVASSKSPAPGEDEEDELAALRREARQAGDDDMRVDAGAPRARRSRARRSASQRQDATPVTGEDEIAALQSEAAAADDDGTLAPPLDGTRSRRSRSRRSGSQAIDDSPAMGSAPLPGLESGRPSKTPPSSTRAQRPTPPTSYSYGVPRRRRTRSQQGAGFDDDDADDPDLAAAIAQSQAEAQEAARRVLEAGSASVPDAAAL